MTPAEEKLIAKLEETALFLRPLNYFWFKTLRELSKEASEKLAGDERETFLEKVRATLTGRKQLSDLFVSAPREREQFVVLRKELLETFQNLQKIGEKA